MVTRLLPHLAGQREPRRGVAAHAVHPGQGVGRAAARHAEGLGAGEAEPPPAGLAHPVARRASPARPRARRPARDAPRRGRRDPADPADQVPVGRGPPPALGEREERRDGADREQVGAAHRAALGAGGKTAEGAPRQAQLRLRLPREAQEGRVPAEPQHGLGGGAGSGEPAAHAPAPRPAAHLREPGGHAGRDAVHAGKLLGHRNLASTERYAHLEEGYLLAAADRVSEAVDALMS